MLAEQRSGCKLRGKGGTNFRLMANRGGDLAVLPPTKKKRDQYGFRLLCAASKKPLNSYWIAIDDVQLDAKMIINLGFEHDESFEKTFQQNSNRPFAMA